MQHDIQLNTGTKKILAQARSVSLSVKEKNDMLAKLKLHMGEVSPTQKIESPFVTHFFWYIENKRTLASLALAVVLIVTGGTSLVARGALPGDLLYPVKIHVNEKAESLLSIGLRSSTETETAHAVARLSEIEDLAVMGKLDPQLKAEAEARFTDSAAKISQDVKQLQVEGDVKTATKVTSGLEDSLSNHKTILNTLAKVKNDQAQLLSDLASTVDSHLKVATEVRSDSEAKIATSTNMASVKVSAVESLQSAQDTAKKVESAITTTASSELKTEAQSELSNANKTIIQGNQKMSAGSYGDAFIIYEKARRTAQGARLMLESENQIKQNIKEYIQTKATDDNQNNTTATSTGATTTTSSTTTNSAEGAQIEASTTVNITPKL